MKNSICVMLLICGLGLFNMSFRSIEISSITEVSSCPSARFDVSNQGCDNGCLFNFINQSQDANSYTWDFGDGTSSSDANPNHNYTTNGSYTVKLTAFGSGCSTEFIGLVDVIGN